jgi:uncharacterized protein (TIGR03083 family)
MMNQDVDLQPLVAAEFQALADRVEGLSNEQWDSPSMCEGWRVREVLAHLTMADRYTQEQFMDELRKDNFDFGSLSNRIAARDAELPTSDLVGSLRSETMAHWAPPDGGYLGALNHVVIHGLDVTVPLGVRRSAPGAAIRIVLESLTDGAGHDHFGVSIEGRSLQATDLDWSWGSGLPLRASAEDLVLVLSGRAVPEERLQGERL